MSGEETMENATEIEKVLSKLELELNELYKFRDLFFESHPLTMASEKEKIVLEKMNKLSENFEDVDESLIPASLRAKYLYNKGRLYNICTTYDARATQYLSKAVKLNPRYVDAWNELGESYWKNQNVKEAKNCFEVALKYDRNKISLRCLSIILRQESTKNSGDMPSVQRSLELSKEAVAKDPKDGVSWSIMGNAQLCKYFMVAQEPATLKSCMSSYKQAESDPIARGQPDLFYNCGVALKYNEQYTKALEYFNKAHHIDPTWDVPNTEMFKLKDYLQKVNDLVKTKGKVKTKKLQQMIQTIDPKTLNIPEDKRVLLKDLKDGPNTDFVVIGKVVGSVLSDNMVPFTFALTDESEVCVSITVYNWSQKGVIIGDTVVVPSPDTKTHNIEEINFKSIRVNNPTSLLVNNKPVSKSQVAGTRVTSTYEIH